MKVSKNNFQGPVFIIGISRSGTKLLRDLLNNHTAIGIPKIESKFIPFLYKKFAKSGDLKSRKKFSVFYKSFIRTPFFKEMKKLGKIIDEDICYNSIKNGSFEETVHTLFSIFAEMDGKWIWGDKTPNYLLYIPLLNTLFPQGKFIHIIRDPRDVCVSAHKAWKRNLYYSAQRWIDHITKCRKDADMYAKDQYFELKYEDLITDPVRVLKLVCEFIGVEYQEKMDVVKTYSETIGNAKDKNYILKNNFGKWKNSISPYKVGKIEKICGTLLKELNYPLCNTLINKPKRVNSLSISVYKMLETWYLFQTVRKDKNIIKAFKAVSYKRQFRL